jgi:hypothetical protein
MVLLQKDETHFERAIHKAKLSNLNIQSSINGLAPIHFAVLWPFGLRVLIDKGVNVNVEDHYGRRPIHLAVGLGHAQSVDHLISADCALSGLPSGVSLLQIALGLLHPNKQQIVDSVVAAVIDRHTRLLDMAIEFLPPSSFEKLGTNHEKKVERCAPHVIETLESRGVGIPKALELDGTSLYDLKDLVGRMRMSTDTANALWDAGFKDINEPDVFGLTPMLQSWFGANFEMVSWFASKGISTNAQHRDGPLTALHFYAKRLYIIAELSPQDLCNFPTDINLMERIEQEVGVPFDDCTCLCSPCGCSPIKFLLQHLSTNSRRTKLQKWLKNLQPRAPALQQYVFESTRCLLFDYLGGKHTCCRLGWDGEIKTRNEDAVAVGYDPNKARNKKERRITEYMNDQRVHTLYCLDRLPIPQKDPWFAMVDEKELRMTLDTLMSHYTEMPRPDTMLPEEQPFEFVRWVIEKGYLAIDVTYDCTHHTGDCYIPPHNSV